MWQNYPRYAHRMQLVEHSSYVPATDGSAKLAMWKRIDIVQDVLTDADRAEAQAVGLITTEDYEARVEHGELG